MFDCNMQPQHVPLSVEATIVDPSLAKPSSCCYASTPVWAFLKLGHFGSNVFVTQYLLADMATAGILPDYLTVGNMISAYADANQPRRAAAVMQSYIDAGGQVCCLPYSIQAVHSNCHIMSALSKLRM